MGIRKFEEILEEAELVLIMVLITKVAKIFFVVLRWRSLRCFVS